MSSLAYHKPLRAVNFICHATQAKAVSLVGDFNNWNPTAHPMQQMPDRSWLLRVELKHGHHRYAFLADGLAEIAKALEARAAGFVLRRHPDHALGFAHPGTPIEVDVHRYGRAVALAVRNEGPPLPSEMEGRLFESMVSIRPAGGSGHPPHLGLGLYVVRLIAEFHGGSAAAHDRPDGRGVIATVTLPLAAAAGGST